MILFSLISTTGIATDSKEHCALVGRGVYMDCIAMEQVHWGISIFKEKSFSQRYRDICAKLEFNLLIWNYI